MASTPGPWVLAYARERAQYKASDRPDMAIAVDEELTRLGWCVDENGDLQEVSTEVTAPVSKEPVLETRPAAAAENRPANSPKTSGKS